ncbi:hypothetical protein CEP54_003026 [Fusarium duplospermum]|uniref:Uncharacterized protein n=1 Tax=Fusarium duplospermum TaxID=1325734 RepID=A0A428QRY8_9HYPO|nr:hypothetical protein CEP54_003026 [Fusarium duplospermum]
MVTDNLLPKDAVDEEGEQVEITTYRRASKAVLVDIVVVAVVASVAMCVPSGLIFRIKVNTRKGFTQSERIRGRFSLLHWAFMRTHDPRLICLATVALPSAFSFSFLTNTTAYEGIEFSIVTVTQMVEPLYGPRDNEPSEVISDTFNSTRKIELLAQLTKSLHNIPPETGLQTPAIKPFSACRASLFGGPLGS